MELRNNSWLAHLFWTYIFTRLKFYKLSSLVCCYFLREEVSHSPYSRNPFLQPILNIPSSSKGRGEIGMRKSVVKEEWESSPLTHLTPILTTTLSISHPTVLPREGLAECGERVWWESGERLADCDERVGEWDGSVGWESGRMRWKSKVIKGREWGERVR